MVSNSYVLVVSNSYVLVVGNSYVWGLVFLRLRVSFLTFWWLVILTFWWLGILTFGG